MESELKSAIEKAEIERLKEKKEALIYEFVGRCEEINDQISRLRKGEKAKPNYQAIKDLSREELAVFLEDVEGFENPGRAWNTKFQPPLPFESWGDWLEREVEYEKV